MTYNELRSALKTLRTEGADVRCKLNAKKTVLQAEYDRLTTPAPTSVTETAETLTEAPEPAFSPSDIFPILADIFSALLTLAKAVASLPRAVAYDAYRWTEIRSRRPIATAKALAKAIDADLDAVQRFSDTFFPQDAIDCFFCLIGHAGGYVWARRWVIGDAIFCLY